MVTLQMDFAENWVVTYPNEPQSAYYGKEPVTLHPVVVHHRTQNMDIEHFSMVMTTDGRYHDGGTVYNFPTAIIPEVSTVRKMVYHTDRPTSQYRNAACVFS